MGRLKRSTVVVLCTRAVQKNTWKCHHRSLSSKCTFLKLLSFTYPFPCKWLVAGEFITNRDDNIGPVFAEQSTVLIFQVKTHHLMTIPSLSLFPSGPLFIQILQTGYFFQFSTFTSFVRERHYASVIMQFITNNRFVYGGPHLSPALSAAFSK